MFIYFTTIFFLLGLVLASFLNALMYRIDNEYKYPEIFVQRSQCEKCKKTLEWYELIPVLSYLMFRGKCRKCGYHVPLYYPFSELFLGLAFALIYSTNSSMYMYFLVVFLFCMAYFDRIYHGVPKTLVHIFLLFSAIVPALLLLLGEHLDVSIFLSIFVSLSIFLVGKILKKPFGFGDILILLGLGLLLSNVQYLVFIYILLITSFVYVIFLLFRKKITLKSKISLVPFMFVSVVLMMLLEKYLEPIITSYLYI